MSIISSVGWLHSAVFEHVLFSGYSLVVQNINILGKLRMNLTLLSLCGHNASAAQASSCYSDTFCIQTGLFQGSVASPLGSELRDRGDE